MDAFFASYAGFTFNRSRGLVLEFKRLCKHQNWTPRSKPQKKAYNRFRAAMIQEFNTKFGTDTKDLGAWQGLCVAVGVESVPESITQCRLAIRKTHVNLVDLLEARDGESVRVFRTLNELRAYTVGEEKYFPKDRAKAGGVLRALLREMQA